MSAAPAVSIVLPTFNRLEFLRAAVDSVLAQTFTDWELIIADDGSEIETLAYLATLAELPRVQVLRLPHTGNPSAVRNAALRAARGQYIAFLDSDDLWLRRKLEIQVAAQRACRVARWSYTALTRIDATGGTIRRASKRPRAMDAGTIVEQLLTLSVVVATPSVLAERSLIEEAGGFDEAQLFFEEYDLWVRLNLLSEVCAIDQPLALVRSHDQHYSADRIGACQGRLRLLDKMERLACAPRLAPVLRLERARVAAALAAVYAASGRRADALTMLWRSRACAWRSGSWWLGAGVTAGRAVAPSWLRGAVRSCRSRQRWGLRPERTAGETHERPLDQDKAEPAQQAHERNGQHEHGGHAVQHGHEPG